MNKECRAQVEPHLQAGEQLIAVCECGLAPGMPGHPLWLVRPRQESDLERRIKARLPGPVQRFLEPSPPKPPSRTGRVVDAVDDRMERVERAIDNGLYRAMHGKALHGGWDSQAGKFLAAYYTTPKIVVQLALAFTDRRVLVLGDRAKLWQLNRVYEPQWEMPRAAVAGIRANPKGIVQRGRFELVFADGSWIALTASVLTHAEPFAARTGFGG
ncbi:MULTISPECIES: hypothetical protein [unclassified Streptomyces]|uniref:hypothetical protein n=1 Tax=unclassified Streptomyces TaxID=2593676 RepID=UPI00278C4445|nr:MULTISPECIES: hypothetical protein [unclassified Streptomyces]